MQIGVIEQIGFFNIFNAIGTMFKDGDSRLWKDKPVEYSLQDRKCQNILAEKILVFYSTWHKLQEECCNALADV